MSTPSPSPEPAKGAAQPPSRRLHRATVLGVVVVASIAALVFGVSWLRYRYEHTVISNATVKGRLHRVGARIDGQVRVIPVTPGQRVSRGDLLVQLEDSHYVAALGQARSEVQSATKRFDAERLAIDHERQRLTLEVDRCESVARAESAEVDAMASTVEKGEREFDRIASLIRAGVASPSEMDRATADRNNARALKAAAHGKLDAAQSMCRSARLALEGLKVREAFLEVLSAEIETGRQRVAAAEADLAATAIRAPEDGWVIDRIVETGGSAKVGEPILALWLGSPWVEAWADEELLQHIRVASKVDVSLKAFPNEKVTGVVESIGVLTDREVQGSPVPSTLHALFPKNAMIPVRVTLSPSDIRFQPGLSALVGIQRTRGSSSTEVAGSRTAPMAALATTEHFSPRP